MKQSEERLILVRLAPEFATKSRGTRQRFGKRLAANMKEALAAAGTPGRVQSEWSRIFVRTTAEGPLHALTRVPGISSFSEVEGRCGADLEEIVRMGTELFADRVVGRTYAVRARRSGTHSFSSADVQRSLGAALNPGATVDLTNPEVEVEVEIRDESVYFFSGRTKAMGGLPLGVEGRALCLLSGGFDSAVAAWLFLKRGVQLDYVFCNLAGDAYERSVVQVGKILADDWSYGTRPRLHVVDFVPVVDAIRAGSNPRYWQVILKRLMYRAADAVAAEIRADGLITGESIGQVSSQTLANLRAIDPAAELPVFRPLIGSEKEDIVALSRTIGTFGISARVKEYCAISPGNPITNATPDAAAREEAGVDLDVVRRVVAERRTVDLRRVQTADLVHSYVLADAVPEDAVVLDVRTEEEWEAWHYPGAERRDIWELMGGFRKLDRDRKYLVYCGQGMQAAHLAELMQQDGYEAYAYRGGIRGLRSAAEGDDEDR